MTRLGRNEKARARMLRSGRNAPRWEDIKLIEKNAKVREECRDWGEIKAPERNANVTEECIG
jgi:hypothetical protein